MKILESKFVQALLKWPMTVISRAGMREMVET